MSWATRMSLAIACTGSVLSPASAGAATENFYGPPGHSAVQEFTELIPDGAGHYNINHIGNAILGRAGSRNLTPADRQNLEALGAQDEAAAALATASAPAADPAARRQSAARADGESPVSATFDRIIGGEGPGGMGPALPIFLLLGAAAALGIGARRSVAK